MKLKYTTYKRIVKIIDWAHTLVFTAPGIILMAPFAVFAKISEWWDFWCEDKAAALLSRPYHWTRPLVIKFAKWLSAHTDMPPKPDKHRMTERDIHNAKVAADLASQPAAPTAKGE